MPFFANRDWPLAQNRPLLFVDLEMTGLEVRAHEIIEVAALLVDPITLKITNSYYTKIFPTHISTADPKALIVNNYDPKTWAESAIPLRQFLEELSVFSPKCILAGWAVANEWNFLLSALEQEKLPYFFDEKLIEVWTLAYLKFKDNPQVPRISLSHICKYLHIPLDLHKPDSDIRATYAVFKHLQIA